MSILGNGRFEINWADSEQNEDISWQFLFLTPEEKK